MLKQRKTKDLGYNRSENREELYKYIENRFGMKEKFCSRGSTKRKNRFGLVHKGKNPLSIRKFNLHRIFPDGQGGYLVKSKDGLQSSCRVCEMDYRSGRSKRSRGKYDNYTPEEIYANYRKEYGKFKGCSMCDLDKKLIRPEDVPISRNMETGLHNVCKKCSKSYTEAVGGRWEVCSPDGHTVIHIKKSDQCKKCGSNFDLHKDHIWPLSKGGSDNLENIQILCETHNLSKSAKIDLRNIRDVSFRMICKRYHDLLKKSKYENQDIRTFELEISSKVKKFIISKSKMSDPELRIFFENEKAKNNRKHSVDHAIKKFRQYCTKSILEVDEYLSSQ
jgi:hypothetical protein